MVAFAPVRWLRVHGGCKTFAASRETAAERLHRGAGHEHADGRLRGLPETELKRRWPAPAWRLRRGAQGARLHLPGAGESATGQTPCGDDRRTGWPSAADRSAPDPPRPTGGARRLSAGSTALPEGGRMPMSTLTSTTSTCVGSPRVHELDRAVARAASVLREDRDRGLPACTPRSTDLRSTGSCLDSEPCRPRIRAISRGNRSVEIARDALFR